MISWTVAREVEFERVESSSTSYTNSQAFSSSRTTSTAIGTDSFTGTSSTAWTSQTTFYSSRGTTVNQTGSTTIRTSSGSYSFTYANSGAVGSDGLFGNSESGSAAFTGQTSGSTLLSTTKETSTTTTYATAKSVTSSNTIETFKWTTTQTAADPGITDFTTVSTTQSYFFDQQIATTLTQDTTTTSGTTAGNATDTVYMAASSEVLWRVLESCGFSEPFTDHAETATIYTASAKLETAALSVSHSSNRQTIVSSTSTSSFSYTRRSNADETLTLTINTSPFVVGGKTTTQTLAIAKTTTSSVSTTLSSQRQVTHVSNTETVTTSSVSLSSASVSDVLGSVSWHETFAVLTTQTATTSINNLVQTFSTRLSWTTNASEPVGGFNAYGPIEVSADSTASSVYGNTVRTKQFLGGKMLFVGTQTLFNETRSAASMTVFSPFGVCANNASGLFFNGQGIPFNTDQTDNLDPEDFSITTNKTLPIANHGQQTQFTTASPITPSSVTMSGNSFTYFLSTNEDGGGEESSGIFGVGGSTWRASARSRANLIGGDLGESETGHIRISRGLYKDETGGTSFFAGDDTTYTHDSNEPMSTTYWYPVSYLVPDGGQNVYSVPRNTSTYPTSSILF